MKSVCITGATQSDLQIVADILQQAGMKPAKPAKRDDGVDMALWHEQVMALAAEEASAGQPIPNPGRLWEQLASDIFVANIKSNLWGWADTRSTWLLDFWLNLEPRLNFLLICTSPERMLASAMTSGMDIVSVDAFVDAWQAQHQQMLRFYHRNPQRCLLVDAIDCAEHPNALIERCSTRWKLPLVATANIAAAKADHDSLALYLAQQMCRGYPQIAGLQQELAATIAPLDGAEQRGGVAEPAAVHIIADYRALRDEAHRKQEFAFKLQKATQEYELLLRQFHQAQEDLEASFLKGEAARKQIDALTQASEEAKLAADRQAKIASPVENKAQAEALKTAQTKLKDAEQENELLLLQLHQVQEELEHYFLQHQDALKQVKTADDRWQRMLQRTPDYCDYESIEILSAEGDSNATTWRIKNLNAAGRALPDLTFKTIVENDIAGFVLSRQPGTLNALTRWPAHAENQNELMLIPVGSRANIQQRIETLLGLATRDWDLLQALTRLLVKTVETSPDLKVPANFKPETLRLGLGRLATVVEKFPATLRYDTVSLKREQVNPDYEHLWLRFENLALGNRRWPEFEFRLSCANVRPNSFGGYPKLEFPEEVSQAPFEAWFIEAYDDFGAKLELRFALPESMDMAVWQRISDHDRIFVAALVKRLPAILATLHGAGVQLRRSWDDWGKMTREMQRVLVLCTAPPLAPAEQPALPAVTPVQDDVAKKSAVKPARISRTRKAK